MREDVPLLERLRYLCIVSSNLDEWFEVRCAPHVTAAKAGDAKGLYTLQSFRSLMDKAHELVLRQYTLYNQSLIPAFAGQGIRVVSHGERSSAQRKWVREYFLREVQPLLMPVGRLAVLRAFPREQFLKAMSFVAIPGLVGPLIGPTLGGWMVEYVSWHWIFLVNVPVGLIGLAATLRFMPVG
ncbi:MFS transporter, partial [Acinetobacter baumannii]|nr:MFS transporter [Acinetobacter baumannii]MCW1766235.1 MFS transporter [Acinetobacter baumannii]